MNAEPGEKNHAFISISSEITFKLEKNYHLFMGSRKKLYRIFVQTKREEFFHFQSQ